MGKNLGPCLPLKQSAGYNFAVKTCSIGPNDRLSSLPDELVFAILSFLSFKEVATTSLLSHRFLNLWLNTPVLIFHSPPPKARDISSEECRRYVSWVNRVLQRHRGQYLTSFEIVCDLDNHYRKDIDKWMSFALSRNVQRLELNLLQCGDFPKNSESNYGFPNQLLEFSSGNGGGGFDLKHLKYLSLKSVDVTGETINMFLLHCPYLERLEVEDTQKLVNLAISGPTLALKYLRIKCCFGLEVLIISNFNLVSLETSSVEDFSLTDLPMLVDLSISKKFGLSLSRSFSEATSCYSQLEALTLRGMEYQDITELSDLDRLTKLKRLTMEVITFCDEDLSILISIINSCPCLEEFSMELLSIGDDPKVERNNSSPKNQTLKVFEFSGYHGSVHEVEFVSHLVANAACLERIIIDPYRRQVYKSDWTEMKNEGKKARGLALQQMEDLRKSGSIPPHLKVVILEL